MTSTKNRDLQVALVAEGFARYVVKRCGSSGTNELKASGASGVDGAGRAKGGAGGGSVVEEEGVKVFALCGWSWKCFEVWIDALERLLEPLDEQIGEC